MLTFHVRPRDFKEPHFSWKPTPPGPTLLRSLRSPGFTRIRSLSLRGLTLPTSPEFFAPVAPTLASLVVRGCSGLCETSFAPLAKLVSLDASSCEPYLPRLVEVRAIGRLSYHRPVCIYSFATPSCPPLQSLPAGLQSLCLDNPKYERYYTDELLRAIGEACPSFTRISLEARCASELKPYRGELGLRRQNQSVGLFHDDRRGTTPAGWAVMLRPPRGLYSLGLCQSLLSRGSLEVLRDHVFDLRCGGRSGTEQSEEVLRAADEKRCAAEQE